MERFHWNSRRLASRLLTMGAVHIGKGAWLTLFPTEVNETRASSQLRFTEKKKQKKNMSATRGDHHFARPEKPYLLMHLFHRWFAGSVY